MWGVAAAVGTTVTLRIEDHDRGRCRPVFETALLDDLEWLGFVPDEPAIASLRARAEEIREAELRKADAVLGRPGTGGRA